MNATEQDIHKLKLGMVCVLNSGSPPMTIAKIFVRTEGSLSIYMVECRWIYNGIPYANDFPIDCVRVADKQEPTGAEVISG